MHSSLKLKLKLYDMEQSLGASPLLGRFRISQSARTIVTYYSDTRVSDTIISTVIAINLRASSIIFSLPVHIRQEVSVKKLV